VAPRTCYKVTGAAQCLSIYCRQRRIRVRIILTKFLLVESYKCNTFSGHHVSECIQDSFVMWNHMQVEGGTYMKDIETLDACQKACLAASACIAVDFSPTTSICWVHHTTTRLFIQPNKFVDHYRIHRCNRTDSSGYASDVTNIDHRAPVGEIADAYRGL